LKRVFASVSLLWIDLHTGKKHQIRRQLSEAGYPVVGDDVYGDRLFNRSSRKRPGSEDTSCTVRDSPLFGKVERQIEILSGLPDDLEKVLVKLK
jgi:23S rRNA pseudouridine955/2504/2580 synthase